MTQFLALNIQEYYLSRLWDFFFASRDDKDKAREEREKAEKDLKQINVIQTDGKEAKFFLTQAEINSYLEFVKANFLTNWKEYIKKRENQPDVKLPSKLPLFKYEIIALNSEKLFFHVNKIAVVQYDMETKQIAERELKIDLADYTT